MERIEFTREMKSDYTILVPDMLPIHFEMIGAVFENEGYHLEILHNDSSAVVEAGLRYVHNDTCYPALLVIGQFLDALNSGKYDINKTALLITQTGGGCRASNYIHLLRKALKKSGHGNKMGEGWLLPAEMLELCEQGFENIVCTQPFGCLPNHIVGKEKKEDE